MAALVSPLGLEQEFEALGQKWKLGRLEIDVLEKFYQWALPQLPDPFQGLDKLIDKVPEATAARLIADAQAKAALVKDWNSPEVSALRETHRGTMQVFLYMLQVHHPDVDLNTAFRIASDLGEKRLNEKLALAAGKPPSPKND